MSVIIPADATDAFSHLFMIGLASILEDAGVERVCTFCWKDTLQAFELKTSDNLDIVQMAEVVHAHAQRWRQSDWLKTKGVYSGKAEQSTMAPELNVLDTAWCQLRNDRESITDRFETFGDYRYFGAIGQPAYWLEKSKYGSSRWEMHLRTSGREFIGDVLTKLAEHVSNRSVDEVRNGICGTKICDEEGKRKGGLVSQSLTACGLHAPSENDSVRAWCAFIGISAFPVFASTQRKNNKREPAAAFFEIKRNSSVEIGYAVLPIFNRYWTTARYRSIVRSAALLHFALTSPCIKDAGEDSMANPAVDWLKEKSVVACCIFKRHKTRSNTPQYWLEPGEIIPVAGAE